MMNARYRSWLAAALICLWANPLLAETTFDAEVRLLETLLEVAPGARIADIGAGGGEFAIALANRVGDQGRVFATELGAEDRAAIAAEAAKAGASQVVVMEARVDGTGLGEASCDGVFLRGVYHHLTEPAAFAQDLFRTIRPGGRLVIVDFPPSFWLGLFTPSGIPDDRGGHGIRPELVTEELERAGFVRVQYVEKWPTHGFVTKNYAVVFERP